MPTIIDPLIRSDGSFNNKRGSTKRNLSADTNEGYANIWHYLDQSAANGGPTLAPNDDIGDGATNCIGCIAAASASGKPVYLPPGIYKIDSNVTITPHLIPSPDAILLPANGVVVTIAGGYTAEDTQQIFDISLGGSFVVRKRASLSVMHWGAVPDYVYPTSGTDNATTIQACFDAASESATALGQRVLVKIPAGPYKILSFLTVPDKVDLEMSGAMLNYRSTDRSDAVLTIGSVTAQSGGKYSGISVSGWWNILTITPAEQQTFACVKIAGASNCEFRFSTLVGAAIGLLIEAAKGTEVSYNKFYGVNSVGTKVGLELRGNFATGYVNENDFFSCNFTPTSSVNNLGAICGVKFSAENRLVTFDHTNDTFTSIGHGLADDDYGHVYAESSSLGIPTGLSQLTNYHVINATVDTFQLSTSSGGSAVDASSNGSGNLWFIGYTGQNNNRFFGTCFQIGGHDAAYTLSVAMAVTTGTRYVNLTNDSEYYCVTGGTIATVPTHKLGTVADANGVEFTYVGVYRKVPVWFDRAGTFNKFYGCRWEFGYGGFCLITQTPVTSFRIASNELEVYSSDANAKADPPIDIFTGLTANTPIHKNKLKYYAQDDPTVTSLDAIHLRAIGSGTRICVKGMFFKLSSSSGIAQSVTGGYILCKNSLYQATFYDLCVALDIQKHREVSFQYTSDGVAKGRLRVYMAEDDYTVIPITDITDVENGASSLSSLRPVAESCWATEADNATDGYFQRNPSSAAKHLIIGLQFNGVEVTNISARPVLNSSASNSGLSLIRFYTPYEADSNLGGRFAYGTPTVGYFLSAGEYISNINTAASQPLGWVVKTAGILAPAWVTATAVRQGELRLSDTDKIYAALSAGTTGATAPTGTADVSDDTITWEYIGIQAVLVATTQVY